MLKIEKTNVVGLEEAVRNIHNSSGSWEKSDSGYCSTHGPAHCSDCIYVNNGCTASEADFETRYIIGHKDLDIMNRRRNLDSENRNFMRMIVVYLDITAPLYWWAEFKAYKIGAISSPGSLTYKVMDEEFALEDFSCENLTTQAKNTLKKTVDTLNGYRDIYINWDEKDGLIKRAFEYNYQQVWWQMIRLLPSSYNQHRTVMLNYEVLADIYKSEKNRSLREWRTFCDWIKSLPYHELITGQK